MMAVLDINIYIVISVILLSGQSSGETLTEYNDLYNNTLKIYNKDCRPVQNQNTVLNATLYFYLESIADLDEVSSKLVTVGLFTIMWKDDAITSEQFKNGPTYYLYFDESLVWKPSMALLNTMSTNTGLLGVKQSKVRYDYNGYARWNIADRFQTTCDFDTSYFPFDKQICEIKIMAWDYSISALMIYPLRQTVDLKYYNENGAWELVSTETRSETLGEYSVVVFSLNLKRRPLYFVIYFLIPLCTMLLLNTLVFMLPPGSGERVSYSINCLLALTVFLTLVSESLPQDSNPMPVIGYVLCVYLIISAIISVDTMVILRLQHKEENEKIPPLLRKIYNTFNFSACKKRSGTVKAYSSHIDLEQVEEMDKQNNPHELPLTWKKLSSRLDTICFISSLCFVIMVGVAFFVIVTVKS